jgi:hypothetical protein
MEQHSLSEAHRKITDLQRSTRNQLRSVGERAGRGRRRRADQPFSLALSLDATAEDSGSGKRLDGDAEGSKAVSVPRPPLGKWTGGSAPDHSYPCCPRPLRLWPRCSGAGEKRGLGWRCATAALRWRQVDSSLLLGGGAD